MSPPLLRLHCRWATVAAGALLLAARVAAAPADPIDYSLWEKYRAVTPHPAAAIKPVDLARARQNLALYPWARDYLRTVQAGADAALAQLSPEHLAAMIEATTPGCVGPCPACRAQGLPWHPNGQWLWREQAPDQLTCAACRTVFPNAQFPETVVLQSTWDPRQKFSFAGGEPFNCFGYLARPSFTGIIRAQKLGHAATRLNTLAVAYALTGEARYARGARAMLLRLAEVLPRYLVRAGYAYGEYADCDPHVAAQRITALPTDELVVPPNRPDRKLHAAYWAASRLGSSGMDGNWVSRVAQAYDLTCAAAENGAPVYAESERRRIERDVLLESAYLAMCDPAINNKSVGNRAGAAMVGMTVGQPELVSFGLAGFRRTVNEWFLPDGGTSESAAYALMTMGGIRNFGLMFRGYSDPTGYRDRAGGRIDQFDASRDTRYGDCWQALIWTLQGDLRHPPIADSYRNTAINAGFAELIALCYPTDEHVALLKEVSGGDAPAAAGDAIFQREPGLEAKSTASLALPDVVFPQLAQGYLRTGRDGRQSLAVLNAADWGSHHHQDSLDLYYWSGGQELLSDLGYLWDHPDKHKTSRAFAHQVVLVDGKEQATRNRGGSFHLFATTPKVKVMEASSRAYTAATVYRRTVIQVDHGAAGSYLVDIFRAQGGESRQFVMHGPGNDFEIRGLSLDEAAATPHETGEKTSAAHATPARELARIRTGTGDAAWSATWQLSGGQRFKLWSAGSPGETVTIGEGWGQRDHRNTDRGAVLPYLIRTTRGSGLDQFVTVLDGSAARQSLTQGVRRLPLPAGSPADAVAVAVETIHGTDVIVSMLNPAPLRAPTPWGELECDGRAAVVLGATSRPGEAVLIGGTKLRVAALSLASPRATFGGTIRNAGSARGESWFVVDGKLPTDLTGQALLVQDGETRRAYPIRATEVVDGHARIYTKKAQAGFEAGSGQTWEIVTSAWR